MELADQLSNLSLEEDEIQKQNHGTKKNREAKVKELKQWKSEIV